MSSTNIPEFGTQLIGRTEKTLGVFLDRELEGTGLTEPLWVSFNVAIMSGPTSERNELAARIAGIFKLGLPEAQSRIDGLIAARVLEPAGPTSVTVSESGQLLYERLVASTTAITERLWGDLPAEDLEVAGRVLGTILKRAEAELG